MLGACYFTLWAAGDPEGGVAERLSYTALSVGSIALTAVGARSFVRRLNQERDRLLEQLQMLLRLNVGLASAMRVGDRRGVERALSIMAGESER